MRVQNITRTYPMPDELSVGQLRCEDCRYNYTCEDINGGCVANCLFNNQVCHYRKYVVESAPIEHKNYIAVETIDAVIGKKITAVEGGRVGDDYFTIRFEDGTSITFYHEQCCCENVDIDDVCGDIDDMVGEVLFKCSFTTNDTDGPKSEWDDSYTWTFYHFATRRGYVDMKWYGTSNGYYSECVSYKICDALGRTLIEVY